MDQVLYQVYCKKLWLGLVRGLELLHITPRTPLSENLKSIWALT